MQAETQIGAFFNVDEVLDHTLAALREKNSALKSNSKRPRKNFAQFLRALRLARS